VNLKSICLFDHLKAIYPFVSAKTGAEYHSIQLHASINHEFASAYTNKRIVFSKHNRIGSDFPFWEIEIGHNGKLTGIYAFADGSGSKANFYYPYAIEDIYESLVEILPGLSRSEWVANVRLEQGSDYWFKYTQQEKKGLRTLDGKDLSIIYDKTSGQRLENMQYYGPKSSKSLGLFSYLLDIFPASSIIEL
jgi:hypothetical protein